MMAAQFYKWTKPNRIITSSLGTMGVGLPYAIGVQVANPNSYVVCIDGDGSFNMTSNDLSTISKYKLPIKIFIMNDGRQQMVHVWQKLFFQENYVATDNHNPDYCKLADSYNIKNYRVTNSYELKIIFNKIMFLDEPVLIDFRVSPDICYPLVPPGNSLSDMLLDNTKKQKLNKA